MFGYETEGMKTIDDIANICRGASPRPISKFVTEDEDGVNWIKIGDVTEDDIYITHTAERITREGAKKSRAVEPGDFILSNSMSFGRPYILGISGCVHDGWLIISDYQAHLDPLFFYYELRSDLVQRQFDGSANGSCVKNLNSDLVKKVKIHIPPMDKQKEFVEFAQQSDKSKFVRFKSQFIEMFGDPIENPNGLTSNLLSDVSEIMSGITKGRKVKTDKLTHVPYICTANVQNGYLDWTETKYIDATDDEIEKYSLESDDLLMIEGGDPDKVGRGYLAGPLPENCIYQNHVFRVRIDKTKVYPEFLAAYILLPSIKDYFLSCAKQTTGIATINKKQLSNICDNRMVFV